MGHYKDKGKSGSHRKNNNSDLTNRSVLITNKTNFATLNPKIKFVKAVQLAEA